MYRNKPILFCTAKMLVSHACKCLRLLRHMNIDLSILILFMYTVNRQLPNDVFYKPQTHTHTQTPKLRSQKPSRYIKRPVETPISEIAGTTTPSFSMVRRCRIFTMWIHVNILCMVRIYKTGCCAHFICITVIDMICIYCILHVCLRHTMRTQHVFQPVLNSEIHSMQSYIMQCHVVLVVVYCMCVVDRLRSH